MRHDNSLNSQISLHYITNSLYMEDSEFLWSIFEFNISKNTQDNYIVCIKIFSVLAISKLLTSVPQ